MGVLRRGRSKGTDPLEDTVLQESATQLTKSCSMKIERHHHKMVVRLSGDLDLTCQERFQVQFERVLDGHSEGLIFDLRGLEFIDSIGLGMLTQIDALARHDGFDFTILCGVGQVREVLRMTGLDGLLPVVDALGGPVPASDSPV
jgi:anti-sigma B factor antagonist